VILLAAVVAGVLTGWGYARWKGWTWYPPIFQSTWLVLIGFLPQWLAFYLPLTRQYMPDEVASVCLVCSQFLLLVFAAVNWRLTGMPMLALGLGCNLAVILANGGFMPLTWDAAASLATPSVLNSLELGERISSGSKDILLLDAQIVLSWLADRFVPPHFLPYRFAFSLGDIFIAIGAFWLLVAGTNFIAIPNSGEARCIPNP
jgi:hypothetical protein